MTPLTTSKPKRSTIPLTTTAAPSIKLTSQILSQVSIINTLNYAEQTIILLLLVRSRSLINGGSINQQQSRQSNRQSTKEEQKQTPSEYDDLDSVSKISVETPKTSVSIRVSKTHLTTTTLITYFL